MDLPCRFSAHQLETILEEALIYLCACPAQLCKEIINLRDLYRYQQDCAAGKGDPVVHTLIARQVAQAHVMLEDCLAEILDIEGWDPATLRMPPGLRQLRDEQINTI